MNISDARKIKDDVRAYFATGAKSANKAYLAKDEDLDLLGFDDKAEPLGKGGSADKSARRNHNASFAALRIDSLRSENSSLTALEYGRVIYTGGIGHGNCTEMACVAAYLADQKDATAELTIAMTGSSGDHVFCVVGPIRGWTKVGEPPASSAASIVIDPWANVCCLAPEYAAAFGATMGKWLEGGKRIFGGGSTWLAPDAKYISGFLATRLDMRNARNSSPSDG
jgi:hypothetical protein